VIISPTALKLLSPEALFSPKCTKISFGGRAPPGPAGKLKRFPPDLLAVVRKEMGINEEGKGSRKGRRERGVGRKKREGELRTHRSFSKSEPVMLTLAL